MKLHYGRDGMFSGVDEEDERSPSSHIILGKQSKTDSTVTSGAATPTKVSSRVECVRLQYRANDLWVQSIWGMTYMSTVTRNNI